MHRREIRARQVVLAASIVAVTAMTIVVFRTVRARRLNEALNTQYWQCFEQHRSAGERWTRFSLNGKDGFKSETGEVKIQPMFDSLPQEFGGETVLARSGNKWGIIGRDGQWVVAPNFDGIQHLCDGLVAARQGLKWGYIDTSGTFVIAPQFDFAFSFCGGMAKAGYETTLSKIKGEFMDVELDINYHFIDATGKRVR